MTVVTTIRIVKGNVFGSPMPEVKRLAPLNPPTDMPDAPALPATSYRAIAAELGATVWTLEPMTQTAPESGSARARGRGELFTADWKRGNIRGVSTSGKRRTFHPFAKPRGANALPIGISANNTRNSEAGAI